ncbi:MAG: CRISPR-associated protein Cas4 [Bryobacteraceae bacterium]
MYEDDDLLPISALQHLRFCERQWGLIHLEQQWEENRLTAEGRLLHDRVHESATEARSDLVITRSLQLRCRRLGLTGQADVVEFRRAEFANGETISLAGRKGSWQPVPIEYKRGRPKSDSCDEIQLCAQALCLEEMFEVRLQSGSLFYGETRRRVEVPFVPSLRTTTESLCRRMHELYALAVTPAAVYLKKCERCSLIDRCLPRSPNSKNAVERYLRSAIPTSEDPT